ncbi:MAG: SRPBCC domain-containing protein [Acidobacteria bacterium]|nr:SRPBCC domain-containing protein [Acidobacteriota bacterium]MCA1609534.1 SRPBCC domain-containing protein [Acidobacteriota bacterium]
MQRFRFLRLLHVSAVLLGALPLIAAPATTFTQGAVKVTETRSPAKRLYFEVVVPATPERVWAAFTTSEGLTTWLAPSAKVRLELGGEWQVSFGSGAPSGGNVLSWLPMEMLSVNAMAPEWFPTVRRDRTIAVFRFEPVGEKQTRVRLAQIGWKDGEEWDKAFDYLGEGNA